MNRPKIPTYYGRLKVAQDAPPEVIRAAYKALVQKYHPDRHKGSIRHEIVLAALNKAQDVLLDPARRSGHDQWIREEEIRLGWREPVGNFRPGFWLRFKLLRASMRVDRLPLGEALNMHFTRAQRVLMLGGAGALFTACAAGVYGVLLHYDPLQRTLPAALSAASPGGSSGAASAPR